MSKLSKYTQSAGYNAGAEAYAKWMATCEIKINPDIAKLFENDRGVVEKIRDSMLAGGFDKSEPLVIWKDTGCVVDGHTRLKAALEAGIEEVLVEEKEFADVNAAKIYTLTRQLNRRNLTAGALLDIASLLDAMKDGGKNKGEVAKGLGVSRTTLYRAQEVNQKASEPVKERVRQGDMSINQAYNKITEKPVKPKPERRRADTDEDDIETEIKNTPSPPAAVSSLSSGENEVLNMSLPVRELIEEINQLLEEFLKFNEDDVLDRLKNGDNVVRMHILMQKLLWGA
jgi:ParB family chromosome partitioning protein